VAEAAASDGERVTVRPARPADRAASAAIDRSFVTDRIFGVRRAALEFSLETVIVDPPLRKTFPLEDDLEQYEQLVAERAGRIIGFAAYRHQGWNRRTELWHLYVAPDARRAGVGRRLVAAVADSAQKAGTRCVWLETTNLAWPAVQFYQRIGFELCGYDTALYDPAGPAGGEVALFFALPIEPA